MAQSPVPKLSFSVFDCPDCGERSYMLPGALPDVGDDVDWGARDFDGIRRFMLEELAARFPERRQWTPADMEVVLSEILAAVLDQLSDMADRVAHEGTLENARHPASVRRLLAFIGYDAVIAAYSTGEISIDPIAEPDDAEAALDQLWLDDPHTMDAARAEGPAHVYDQHRMVTVDDYALRLDDHPMVLRAKSSSAWTGSWETISVAVILADTGWRLDTVFPHPDDPAIVALPPQDKRKAEERIARLRARTDAYHKEIGLPLPLWDTRPSLRGLIRPLVDAYRMAAQPVDLIDAVPVGIAIVVSLIVRPTYFRSEVRRAAETALGNGPGGFFEPGRLGFGEDLFASDLIAMLMGLDGVENVCLIRFKRVGDTNPDDAETARIQLDGLEIAVCDNDRARLERGYFQIRLNGGARG